ncbi:juvenile hormone acid O-methyltransferase-like [Haematobia irritans]|uniref:juvenile hormone acid O-methyltransferase-like n=1 Tax=Haematobia irritans TaxID=7368 RepID=UPI003F5007F1
MDLGSGSGDVLMDFVYPHLPKNYQRLVCSDINPKMVEYSRKYVVNVNRSECRIFDMATVKPLPHDLKGQFDHVTSFFAFMYAKSQRQALKNVYDLLKPHQGDCFIVSLVTHPLFGAYIQLSQMKKWSKYMTDVSSFVPPQYYCEDPRKDIVDYLSAIGFSDYSVEVVPTSFVYDNVKAFKDNMMGCNPFIDRIEHDLQDEFIDDYLTVVFSILGLEMKFVDHEGPFPLSYKNMIIYARKSN